MNNNNLSVLAMAAEILGKSASSGIDLDLDQDQDDFSDRENAPQSVKCFFSRNPERHRVLERARRSRLRKVMDELLAKLPENLCQEKHPNKVKPSQIDVMNLAIDYIQNLESLVYRSDKSSLKPDLEKEKHHFDLGYRQCAEDLFHYAKREQFLCSDSRRLMSYVQSKVFPSSLCEDASIPNENYSIEKPLSSSQNLSFLSQSKAPKRQLESNNSSNADSLSLSVFKRPKMNRSSGYYQKSSKENNKPYLGNFPKIRLNRTESSSRSEEQSLLAPIKSPERDSDSKPDDSPYLISISSPDSPPPSPDSA